MSCRDSCLLRAHEPALYDPCLQNLGSSAEICQDAAPQAAPCQGNSATALYISCSSYFIGNIPCRCRNLRRNIGSILAGAKSRQDSGLSPAGESSLPIGGAQDRAGKRRGAQDITVRLQNSYNFLTKL